MSAELATYSLAQGIDASYTMENGQETINLRSSTAFKPMEVQSGVASLRFVEVKANTRWWGLFAIAATKGTGYSIKFKPTFLKSKPTDYPESIGKDGIHELHVRVEVGPCVGFTTFRRTVDIVVPAIRLVIPPRDEPGCFFSGPHHGRVISSSRNPL